MACISFYNGASNALKYYPKNLLAISSLVLFANYKHIKIRENEKNCPLKISLIAAPIFEELLFRSGFQNFLNFSLKRITLLPMENIFKISSLSSSLLCASWHIYNSKKTKPIQYFQAINVFLLSYFLFSKTYNQAGIIGSIASHMMNNFLIEKTSKIYLIIKQNNLINVNI